MNIASFASAMSWIEDSLPDEMKGEINDMVTARLKEIADDVLDVAENFAERTENTLDDKVVGYLTGKIREKFDIPDDIGGDED